MNAEIEILPWSESKWLVGTSAIMILPVVIYNDSYYNTIITIVTAITSINYWRRATYSHRRTADFIIANAAASYMLINGIIYVRYTPYVIVSAFGLIILLSAFYLSVYHSSNNNPNWWKYHALFHIISICELFIILDSIHDYTIEDS